MPAFDYTIVNNREELLASNFPPVVIDGIDDSLHKFDEQKSYRQYKNLLLQFPDGHILSSSVISADAGEDENLGLTIHEVELKDDTGRVYDTRIYGGFSVARTDISPLKRGKVEAKENISKGAQLIREMRQAKMSQG